MGQMYGAFTGLCFEALNSFCMVFVFLGKIFNC